MAIDSAEWMKPRTCNNCPEKFRPLIKSQRFCCDNCRKEFHKYGGTFPKLKAVMEQIIVRRIREVNHDTKRFEGIEARLESLEKWRNG